MIIKVWQRAIILPYARLLVVYDCQYADGEGEHV